MNPSLQSAGARSPPPKGAPFTKKQAPNRTRAAALTELTPAGTANVCSLPVDENVHVTVFADCTQPGGNATADVANADTYTASAPTVAANRRTATPSEIERIDPTQRPSCTTIALIPSSNQGASRHLPPRNLPDPRRHRSLATTPKPPCPPDTFRVRYPHRHSPGICLVQAELLPTRTRRSDGARQE